MNMDKKSLALSITLLAATSAVSAEGLGLTVHGGTLGAGAAIVKSINPNFNVRLGFNAFNYSKDMTESGTDYNVDLKLHTVSLLADWQIMASGFRATAGLVSNGNKLGMVSSGAVDINGTSYAATLNSDITFKSTAPYVGIGWGNAVKQGKKFGFNIDVGVLMQDSPIVALTCTGGACPAASEVEAERTALQDSLNEFKNYPVFSAGMTYHF